MAQIEMTDDGLKQVLKEVLVEVMEERREYLRDLIEEVMEEFEMIEDHREVRTADPTGPRPVFSMNPGEA